MPPRADGAHQAAVVAAPDAAPRAGTPGDGAANRDGADGAHGFGGAAGRDDAGGAWTAFRPTPRLFRAVAWVVHRAAWRLRLLEYALAVVERELTSTVAVPWYRRPGLWRRGFLSESRVLYGLDRRRGDDYLNDVERTVRSRTINGAYSVLLDDKLQFDRLMAPWPELKPRMFGVLSGARVRPVGEAAQGGAPMRLIELLRRERSLALKPASGGGGKGFVLLEWTPEGALQANGRDIAVSDLDRLAAAADGNMVTEHVVQHPTMAALYPRTTNTIRLITMQDARGRPFIARAVVRIGRARSEPTDNWIKGGLCAAVELESGTIGPAAPFPARCDRMTWYETHPETGAPLAGVRVPGWGDIRRRILELAGANAILPYVGWDIAVAPRGFRVIEGNSYSGVNLLQIHGPLLTDDRVRAFFRRHGVIRR